MKRAAEDEGDDLLPRLPWNYEIEAEVHYDEDGITINEEQKKIASEEKAHKAKVSTLLQKVGAVHRSVRTKFAETMLESSLEEKTISDLKDCIKSKWVEQKERMFGIGFVRWEGDTIKASDADTDSFPHSIFTFQIWGFCNVFIYPDRKVSVDEWSHRGIRIDEATTEMIKQHVLQLSDLPEHAAFWEREKKFWDGKIWRHVDGLTPEEAVKKLEELGW